jgi:hypothetical protein
VRGLWGRRASPTPGLWTPDDDLRPSLSAATALQPRASGLSAAWPLASSEAPASDHRQKPPGLRSV